MPDPRQNFVCGDASSLWCKDLLLVILLHVVLHVMISSLKVMEDSGSFRDCIAGRSALPASHKPGRQLESSFEAYQAICRSSVCLRTRLPVAHSAWPGAVCLRDRPHECTPGTR